MELDVSYNIKDFNFGIKYNQEKNYFERLEDNYIIYLYTQFPIKNNLKIELSGGYGYLFDYECNLIYEIPNFQLIIGRSLTDIFVFEIKYFMYYEKR